jgi:hypothetical protein
VVFEEIDGKTKFTYGLTYRLPVPVIGGLLDKLYKEPAWEGIIENSFENRKDPVESERA